ncbi:MAG TPA: adenine deaminase [Pirellulales bacterium]|jgi:adenine deaminase|nr:adenine deaminase [Pirellulales bacterium]
MMRHAIAGYLVDVVRRRVAAGTLTIDAGRVVSLVEHPIERGPFIMPGFVDSHIHIESSMMPPSSFAQLAIRHGTVATVSDPHEIANVLGIAGIEYMLDSARGSPLKFHFGAPSCVPATQFETAGAHLDVDAVRKLLMRDDIWYLSEMMNYPGVLAGELEVLGKIAAAHALGKPVDGHAPGLRGSQAKEYIASGISTDHECVTLEEAQDKLAHGMKILIREGSAARNYEALKSLLATHAPMSMLCSDDKHPDELLAGHIDAVVRRAVADGLPIMNVLEAACVNPVRHYRLNVGLLQPGDAADFIVVEDLERFRVLETWINGQCVYDGQVRFEWVKPAAPNHFASGPKHAADFSVRSNGPTSDVIVATDRQLITDRQTHALETIAGLLQPDVANDILKLAVVNRYRDLPPAVGFIRGLGLRQGAIASSIAHDSHNMVAAGVSDEMIARAINLVIDHGGGVCYVDERVAEILPLPIAGLMSDEHPNEIAARYAALDALAKLAGSRLSAPFMTLSFMALLVIPKLKLSDRGLFDGERFALV